MSGRSIAWAGELMLLESKWTDKDGHLVKFKLVTPNEDRPNPFKSFTKRRSGKAGTRFFASLSHVQDEDNGLAYGGEFMLAGWGDTSTQGYTVTFWCERPETGMHVFEGFTRNQDTFMAALVELDDDNQGVDQKKRERVEKAAEEPQRGRRKQTLAQAAGMLCSNPDFWEYINMMTDGGVMNAEGAAEWMRRILGIESRRELDHDEGAAQRFHREIRLPFVEFKEGR